MFKGMATVSLSISNTETKTKTSIADPFFLSCQPARGAPAVSGGIDDGFPMEGRLMSFCSSTPYGIPPHLSAWSCGEADGHSNRSSHCGETIEPGAALQYHLQTIDGVHAIFGSTLLGLHTEPHVPDQKVVAAVAGTGLAPWEIHRPQKFVRDLVLRRCFSGRVLDAGCGIGDNALYVAKACPAAVVTAVDVVPRCLDFAGTKAGLRGMRSKVTLVAADLRDYSALSAELRSEVFDVVLDSFTFHGFTDSCRAGYIATLRRLLRPGGVMYVGCMSEEETRPGGPRRISVLEANSVFNRAQGWEVEAVEDSAVELHPTFWGGKAKAHLFTIRRL